MKIFQKEPIFKAGFTYKEVAGLIVTVFFAIPVLILIFNALINNFLETISLLELAKKGEIFFSMNLDIL